MGRPIRCRNYDDGGKPIGRGCLRLGTCDFIHPSDALWKSATRRQPLPERPSWPGSIHKGPKRTSFAAPGPSGSGRLPLSSSDRRSSLTAGTSSGGRGAPDTGTGWGTSDLGTSGTWATKISNEKNKPSDSNWGGSGWGSGCGWGEDTSAAQGKGKDVSQGGWGDTSNWGPSDDTGGGDNSVGAGWGDTSNWGPSDDTGGGNNSVGAGWGDTSNWGPSDDTGGGDNSVGTGWGDTSNWGPSDDTGGGDNSAGAGWGDTSNWGASGDTVGANQSGGWGNSADWGQSSAGPSVVPSAERSDGWGAATRRDSGISGGGWGEPTAKDGRTSSGGDSGVPMAQDSVGDWGESSKISDVPMQDPTVESQRPYQADWSAGVREYGSEAASRAASPSASEATVGTSRQPVANKARRHKIQSLRRAIRAQNELVNAERAKERWKRTQLSQQFGRVGRSGRKKLDDIRKDHEKTVKNCKTALSAAVLELSDSPGFATSPALAVDIVEYENAIVEHRKWLHSITSIVQGAIAASHERPDRGHKPETEKASAKRGLEPPSDSTEHSEFNVKIENTENLLEDLEARLLSDDRHMLWNLVDQRIKEQPSLFPVLDSDTVTQKDSVVQDEGLFGLKTVEDCSQRADDLGMQVTEIAKHVSSIIYEHSAIRQQGSDLVSENDKLKNQYQMFEKRHVGLESALLENSNQLAELSVLLKGLSTRDTMPLSDGAVEDVLSFLKPMLLEKTESDLRVMLDSIRAGVSTSLNQKQQELYMYVWHKLQPGLSLAKTCRDWAETNSKTEKGVELMLH